MIIQPTPKTSKTKQKSKHVCVRPNSGWPDHLKVGTIWRCDTCGRFWKLKGGSIYGNYWGWPNWVQLLKLRKKYK